MKTYNILIKDVYTDDKRSETIECPDATDIRDIHKQAMKSIRVAEDIECITTETSKYMVYSIDRGFLA
tara:strand:+ start:133 stop:336 length:204 start_codon:yes stop_codon:yes gene_type:complete